MSLLEAVILGVVQGLSEFLPISSSGHLVLVEHWLGIASADFTFEIVVHAGTLVSLIIFFRKRLWEFALSLAGKGSSPMRAQHVRRDLAYITLASIPAGIVGILFKDYFESAFGDAFMSAIQIAITGVILLATHYCRRGDKEISTWRAWWVGCAQAISILPGISRSGATISAGLFQGVRPAIAAEFSFLLSIPAIVGAIALTIPDVVRAGTIGTPYLIAAVVAGITGYFALRLVFAFLRGGRFALFGVYCLIVGGISALLLS